MLYTSVVGVDPSLTGCAVALLPRRSAQEFGDPRLRLVKTRPNPKIKTEPSWRDRQRRIDHVAREALRVIPNESVVFIEAPAYSSNQGSAFDRYRLWEQIVGRCRNQYCTIVPVLPQHRAMWATGAGNAGKADVVRHMTAKFPDIDLTYRGKADDNLCDAMALAALGAEVLGDPIAPLISDGARQAVKMVSETMTHDQEAPLSWQFHNLEGKWETP